MCMPVAVSLSLLPISCAGLGICRIETVNLTRGCWMALSLSVSQLQVHFPLYMCMYALLEMIKH